MADNNTTDDASPDDPDRREPTGSAADSGRDDVVTDPAKDDSGAGDWTDEGGATPEGPATDTAAALQ